MRDRRKPVLLPADVFDALELSVLASDEGKLGSGAGNMYCDETRIGCILAHAAFLDGAFHREGGFSERLIANWSYDDVREGEIGRTVREAFAAAGRGAWSENDYVCAVKPLTWAQFCRKLLIRRVA